METAPSVYNSSVGFSVLKHDLILLQEIRDKDASSMDTLLEGVTHVDKDYKMSMSEPLGRTRSKERYAFFYRTERLTVNEVLILKDVLNILSLARNEPPSL